MGQRNFSTILSSLFHALPDQGPPLAEALKSAGARAQQAAEVIDAVSDPDGPLLRGFHAIREGRIRLDIQDGRVGFKIVEPHAHAQAGRVHW